MEKELRESRQRLFRLYPDDGPLRRELYPKHMAFFAAGAEHQERCFMAGNRVGKTLSGCYELTCHMIGWYPTWWTGYRFDRPIVAWASGEDAKSVRESIQQTLFGAPNALGTGTIPYAALHGKPTARGGVPEAIDTALVKTNFGPGQSRIVLKSYDQGREAFQASKVDVVLFDEEPPMDIYTEGLTRTMSTVPGQRSGIVMCTFTPLKGLSAVALAFMPGGQRLEGAVP
jgi:phage terminase large subunit-like protein